MKKIQYGEEKMRKRETTFLRTLTDMIIKHNNIKWIKQKISQEDKH